MVEEKAHIRFTAFISLSTPETHPSPTNHVKLRDQANAMSDICIISSAAGEVIHLAFSTTFAVCLGLLLDQPLASITS